MTSSDFTVRSSCRIAAAKAALPFSTTKEIDVGIARVRAARMSYVGGPGFELYVPTDQCVTLYDALWECGAEFGLTDAGYYTIDALRIEAGRDFEVVNPDSDPRYKELWQEYHEIMGRHCGYLALMSGLATGAERQVMDPVEMDMSEESFPTAGTYPTYQWTPDGKSIVIPQGGKIRRVDVATGQVSTIPFTARVHRVVGEAVGAVGRRGGQDEGAVAVQVADPAEEPTGGQ